MGQLRNVGLPMASYCCLFGMPLVFLLHSVNLCNEHLAVAWLGEEAIAEQCLVKKLVDGLQQVWTLMELVGEEHCALSG